MTINRKIPRDEFDVLQRQLIELRREVKMLRDNRHPTVPIYDSVNFPQDPVEGQSAIGMDDTYWFYSNGAWHPTGGGSSDPWHIVGDTGEPPYNSGWGGTLAFRFSDPYTVEIEGQAINASGVPGDAIFTLPATYHPDVDTHIASADELGNFVVILVDTGGVVTFLTVQN